MASAYLGPEIHRPLSVISESYQTRLRIPSLGEEERYRFGKEYETKLFSLLHEHLELGTTDKMVYVGDIKGSMSEAIEEKFCLVHPVQTVIPGHFHYAETEGGAKMLPIRIAHVGAEEFFRNLAENESADKPQYDRILVDDCVRYLAEPRVTYKNMVSSLAPNGRLLLIHRPGDLSTLPYFSDARQRLSENEIAYSDIIRDLQACRLDVSWELECLPVRMPKRKWLAMLRERYPTQTEILSQMEVVSGIRELSEGVLKYEGDMVEFVDRQLFISATPCRLPTGIPTVKRGGAELELTPKKELPPLKYVMKICPEQLKELRRKPEEDLYT
ncbi:methyltransferase type 11 [Plakobranchus ocellatus]|uniref:Methyltransferase type 11 n=1 Tax=Plakobranchus ocellatus TaxID=259542 RepID=A0AAV4D007_9GAST|nr:methyltransferase type 11 [Plakobranchus ocellatus]